mgnify:FL=1|jgi:hypothetical protein|tara:strand:- start:372 stop:740 length:369 start_codon:yes stop_codon:yes gene_type:complete
MSEETKKFKYKRKPNLKEKLVRKFHKAIGNENKFTKAIGLEEGELVDKQAEAYNKIFGRDMFIERAKELDNLEKFGTRPNLMQLNKRKKKNKDSKAGGGKVGSKFFTGGSVHASFGKEFDDR